MTALGNFADGPSGESARPLKICLLGYRSHPHCGGQGIYLHYLSKALLEAGHSVDVISGQPYPDLDPRVRLIKMPGLNLFEVENPTRALRWKHLLSWTDFFEWWSKLSGGFAEPYTFGRRVARYLRRHGQNYDIVHDNQSLCYGLLDIIRAGLPLVATIHHPITRDRQLALDAAPDWRFRLLVRRWYNFLSMQIKVARRLPHIVTVSRQSERDIVEQFGVSAQHIKLVYNGIDTEVFRPQPQIARNPLRIMTTASADQPLKGLRYLLEALASLRSDFPQIELLVVGKLHRGGATEQLLEQLALHERVTFVSGISTAELVEYYASAGVVVCPSLYEGFGLPAGEAMACGAPVISSDGGALPEVVGDAGLIVPAGDSAQLADALRRLLLDDQLRESLAQQGRARIESKFCWRLAAEHMVDFYRRILRMPCLPSATVSAHTGSTAPGPGASDSAEAA